MNSGRQCVRCRDPNVFAVDEEDELCGHCYWITMAEVAEGLAALDAYLAHWAAFAAWDDTHPH